MSRARDISDGKFANDLTVDTNTLHVDSANNKVGIGTTSPTYQATVFGSSQGTLEIESGSDTGESRLYFTDPTTTGVGTVEYHHNGNTMRFQVNSAERMRLTADGLTFNGDTAAANALDDYEEGTFTPQLLGGTSNPSSTVSGSGEYIKVGKLVFIYIKFHNVNTTGASGYIRITGQPFSPSQTNGPLSMSAYDFDFNGRTSLTAEINNGEINGITSGDDTGWGLLNFGAGTARYIFIAGTYRIA